MHFNGSSSGFNQGSSSYTVPGTSPYNQYSVNSGVKPTGYGQPIQMSHYQPPAGMFPINNTQHNPNVQIINQPSSYQVNTSNFNQQQGQGQSHSSYQSAYIDRN